MSAKPDQLVFDLVEASELDNAIAIENLGFPADEAGSLEAFRYRQSQAPDLFLGVYGSANHQLLGYVCSTLSSSPTLTHSSMSTHEPNTSSVCIHSICVHPDYKRQGVGLRLLKEYIRRLRETGKHERVLLICHEELRSFYETAGFEFVAKSEVHHGSRDWYEMRIILKESEAQPTTIPPGVWEVLNARPSRARPASRFLDSYPDGDIQHVVVTDDIGTSFNKFDLLCPRKKCASIILKANVGKWVERSSVQIDPPMQESHPSLPTLLPPPQTVNWWLITPSPMQFENIGFSRPVAALKSPSGKPLKLLACAECDLGPLGWSEEGGQEFWLLCNRVGYRDKA